MNHLSRALMHTIRGSCGYFGAARLGELCQEIENLARSGSLERASDLTVAVNQEYEKVRAELLAAAEKANPWSR